MAKRHIMRIELTGPAKKKLATLSDQQGMTQLAMMSRLVEWFASEDPATQVGIVAQVPGRKAEEVVRAIVRRMAE